MPVPAGMITVVLLAAVITPIELASTGGGATTHQIFEHLLLTGQQRMLLSIRRAVEAEDVRHLDHERRGLQSVHQLVDRGFDRLANLVGQVRVKSGGSRSRVAENALDNPQVDARFQQVSRHTVA